MNNVARLPVPRLPGRTIDASTDHAARRFLARAENTVSIATAILYGSRARGDHQPDSDADLALILRGDGASRSSVIKAMAAISFHILLETGIMVEAFPLFETEVERPSQFSNPTLIANILRDGIQL
jgi:uncharacterized protein